MIVDIYKIQKGEGLRIYVPGKGALDYTVSGSYLEVSQFHPMNEETSALSKWYAILEGVRSQPSNKEDIHSKKDLPSEVLAELVTLGEQLNQAQREFRQAGESLTDLLEQP